MLIGFCGFLFFLCSVVFCGETPESAIIDIRLVRAIKSLTRVKDRRPKPPQTASFPSHVPSPNWAQKGVTNRWLKM